jgi:hypothetical protein
MQKVSNSSKTIRASCSRMYARTYIWFRLVQSKCVRVPFEYVQKAGHVRFAWDKGSPDAWHSSCRWFSQNVA